MDNFQKYLNGFRLRLFFSLILENLISVGLIYLIFSYLNIGLGKTLIVAFLMSLVLSLITSLILSKSLTFPTKQLQQAVLRLTPSNNQPVSAPDTNKLSLGKELVSNLISQIYQISAVASKSADEIERTKYDLTKDFMANSIPLPIFVLDTNENIKFANKTAAKYLGMDVSDLINKNIYSILDMSFPNNNTFDAWLNNAKQNTANSSNQWERVKLNIRDQHPALYFDLSAYYNITSPEGYCTIITIFDHTKQYSQDDQSISFVALTVHELRTPLTLLKGYIEVFNQEFKGKLNPEMDSFLDKMRASSDQLTAFVNNILNVARVDNDQMELKLQKENWNEVLNQAIDTIDLRARVRGISLQREIANNIPLVGVDRLSIQEVILNLIDNAIKYSADSKIIKIKSHINGEGLVETTVQDFGRGIPESIISNLFTKFYRDHHNRSQVGGTGLGLYLSKAIIDAHQGNIWVHSKEGEGSTFGFTILPFDKLSQEQKKLSNDELVRSAHGWIKNHSYYRR